MREHLENGAELPVDCERRVRTNNLVTPCKNKPVIEKMFKTNGEEDDEED